MIFRKISNFVFSIFLINRFVPSFKDERPQRLSLQKGLKVQYMIFINFPNLLMMTKLYDLRFRGQRSYCAIFWNFIKCSFFFILHGMITKLGQKNPWPKLYTRPWQIGVKGHIGSQGLKGLGSWSIWPQLCLVAYVHARTKTAHRHSRKRLFVS